VISINAREKQFMATYETIIGLEVHAQILTQFMMFCGSSADYASTPPNTHICPVCMALPGVLPVINRVAIEKTILAGLALNPERAGNPIGWIGSRFP
jgi:aspartyl-tRNA(Asn)/glutamyl-tRNA(Gln) amidotransferase subunit B